MCVLSTLCGNIDKHSPFDIWIYVREVSCIFNAYLFMHFLKWRWVADGQVWCGFNVTRWYVYLQNRFMAGEYI